MTDEELTTALELMNVKVRSRGYQKSVSCPLAEWLHPNGRDKHPSFSAKSGDPAVGYCFACKEKGSIRGIAKKYAQYSGDVAAYNFVSQCERKEESLWGRKHGQYGDYNKNLGKRLKISTYAISEEDLERYRKRVHEYTINRGLTKEQIVKWDIGYDGNELRMTIPVKDERGKLFGVSGRDVTGVQEPKYKHYYGLKKEQVLYGEQYREKDNPRSYVVEGFFDVYNLERHGLSNIFAVMGSELSLDQRKKLLSWSKEVVFFPDLDDSGQGLKFCQESMIRLSLSTIRVGVVGVELNPNFATRPFVKEWEPNDYMFFGKKKFMGKDPANWSKQDLDEELKEIRWFRFSDGELRLEK